MSLTLTLNDLALTTYQDNRFSMSGEPLRSLCDGFDMISFRSDKKKSSSEYGEPRDIQDEIVIWEGTNHTSSMLEHFKTLHRCNSVEVEASNGTPMSSC